MSDDRPIEPDETAGPAPEPEPESASAPPSGRAETRPRRSARHAHSQARPARPARPVRAARTEPAARPERRAHASAPARTRTGLPSGKSAVRRRLVIALVVLALFIGGLGYAAWSTLYRVTAKVPAGRSVAFTIAPGTTGEKVAAMLAAAGIVDNPMMFRWRAQQLEATSKLKAGEYTLKTGSSYDDVIAILTHGPEIVTTTITIPEGFDIKRTAARVEEKLGIPAAEFTDVATTGAKSFDFAFLADDPTRTLEGYLFPKTYSFKPGVTATDVITTMLTQYGKETAGIDYSFSKSRYLSPHDVLTIASIIEREAQLDKDRPKVASVIYNRLKINMRLQLDSTVQYALNGKAKLTLDDLKTDNPYNTYVYAGVPPGPICSPGISAIRAAANPATTTYLYYILTHKDGSQSFATNYADFLVLKAQFKRGLK